MTAFCQKVLQSKNGKNIDLPHFRYAVAITTTIQIAFWPVLLQLRLC